MTVVVVGRDLDRLRSVVVRLREQGDDVAAVVEPHAAATVRELGAIVAQGAIDDADLIERAAQGARTIVVLDDDLVEAALGALRHLAGVRLVACLSSAAPVAHIEAAGPSYVALIARRRLKKMGPDDVARAVDAADDLAGEPRLVADLTRAEGWRDLAPTGDQRSGGV